ncbi:Hypothetical predicted protein [Pelobates cultripes]|uniref:Uncharacterized protein n=1 Tax=Pelobates cultripes TaxID=61616 RepID=A0AAD1TNS6_PELCU|nr:Hypothetical predicted protein [Pelobates cultripes]
MADHSDTTVSNKRWHIAADIGDHARDPITLIFVRFWAMLKARLQPEVPSQNIPKGSEPMTDDWGNLLRANLRPTLQTPTSRVLPG